MIDLLDMHKYFINRHIIPGCTAVDCTMGNGHDTLYLSRSVGENGHVYAFDIQEQAVESTKKLLVQSGAYENYTLILDSHAEIKKYVKESPRVVMFNLGYLPGGDHSVTTLRTSTKAAIEGAMDILADDGIILAAVYPGHAEGELEGQMLDEMFKLPDRRIWCISKLKIVNSPSSPYFFAVEKK